MGARHHDHHSPNQASGHDFVSGLGSFRRASNSGRAMVRRKSCRGRRLPPPIQSSQHPWQPGRAHAPLVVRDAKGGGIIVRARTTRGAEDCCGLWVFSRGQRMGDAIEGSNHGTSPVHHGHIYGCGRPGLNRGGRGAFGAAAGPSSSMSMAWRRRS